MTDEPTQPDVSLRRIGNVTIESTKVPTSVSEAASRDCVRNDGWPLGALSHILSAPGETVTKAR